MKKFKVGDKVFYPLMRELEVGTIIEIENEKVRIKYGRETRTFLHSFLDKFEKFNPKNRNHYYGKKENVVFKLRFNDRNYKNKCGNKIIEYNKSLKRAWCLIANCKKEKYPCDESKLFTKYEMSAGSTHFWKNGKLKPRKLWTGFAIKYVKVGKIAFFTTNKPNEPEKNRYIFGLFLIRDIYDPTKKELKEGNATVIYGNKTKSFIFDNRIKIPFWKFYKNRDGSIEWGNKLFRYLSDENVLKILKYTISQYENIRPTNTKIRNHVKILYDHLNRYKLGIN